MISQSAGWFVQPRKSAAAVRTDPATGEARVPVTLWRLDDPICDIEMVLNRVDARRLAVMLAQAGCDQDPSAGVA